jgi:N utilization substance protein B
MDKRHQRRVDIIQKLFSYTFEGIQEKDVASSDQMIREIVGHLKDIDDLIRAHAPRYPLGDIARVDLSILRLGIYELLYEKSNPPKVVIDEAVRLAKEYGNERSYSFVNGVLGSVLKDSEVKNLE